MKLMFSSFWWSLMFLIFFFFFFFFFFLAWLSAHKTDEQVKKIKDFKSKQKESRRFHSTLIFLIANL